MVEVEESVIFENATLIEREPPNQAVMRIVLSNASKKWGGVHKVTEILARGLLSRGHEVTVLGSPNTMLEERMRAIAPFEGILGGMDFHPLVMERVAVALKRNRADVMITLTRKDVAVSGPGAFISRVPVVVRHANQQPLKRLPHFRWVYGKIPAMHVTNAEATRQTLLDSARWLKPEKVRVIYNGVDPDPLESAEPLSLGLPEGSLAIGFVGSFERRKGVLELATAWPDIVRAMPAAHLILCGKGSLESEMRSLLKGIANVHWIGYHKDIPRVMRALDMLVLPSHIEGAPNVVLEAMAARVAVIATSVSGTPELVRDGAEARLILPANPREIVKAVIELGSNERMRKRMTEEGARRVKERFTIPRMIDEYEALLAGVTEAGKR
jgi:glycosyltransferase involved in cell wall biosynthesis